ncbi:MAG TPA: glycosyltransferase, partial [Phycisphaerae bacterium]|nr:glycosyltransferase [Phycisphaerae bacterium]
MLVSICINARNEGPRVAATVRDLAAGMGDTPHEFLIYDDASEDGSCDGIPNSRVLRSEAPVGCGRAKGAMLAAATGDVVMFADAHMTPLSGDLAAFVRAAFETDAVLTPALCGTEYDTSGPTWTARRVEGGRLFVPNDSAVLPGATNQYRIPSSADLAGPYESIMPSCLTAARRDIWDRAGGWNAYTANLGSQERGLALRAFMARIPIVVWPGLVVGHEFNRKGSTSRAGYPYKPVMNAPQRTSDWHAYITVFGREAFERELKSAFESDPNIARGASVWNDPAAEADAKAFVSLRKRDAEDVLALMVGFGWDGAADIPADPGGASLEPAALAQIGRFARGDCLEFGTGIGAGTRALLDVGARHVVSLDHGERWTLAARQAFGSALGRLDCRTAPLDPATGFYALPADVAERQFDTILMDGPPGGRARRNAPDT